jgi:hypothetical protein
MIYEGVSVPETVSRISEVNLGMYILKLRNDSYSIGKEESIVYTPNTIAMWKFIIRCAVKNQPITIDNFNRFMADFIGYYPDADCSLTLDFNKQTTARAKLKEKIGSGMVSVDYCELFFDLNIPTCYSKFIREEYQSDFKERIVRYSMDNLRVCLDVVTVITDQKRNPEYLNMLNTLRQRLMQACSMNNLSHLITKIAAL